MLTVTKAVAGVLSQMDETGNTTGIRVTLPEGRDLHAGLVSAGRAGDVLIELGGGRIYFAAEALEAIDGTVLDAAGEGESLRFELSPQAPLSTRTAGSAAVVGAAAR